MCGNTACLCAGQVSGPSSEFLFRACFLLFPHPFHVEALSRTDFDGSVRSFLPGVGNVTVREVWRLSLLHDGRLPVFKNVCRRVSVFSLPRPVLGFCSVSKRTKYFAGAGRVPQQRTGSCLPHRIVKNVLGGVRVFSSASSAICCCSFRGKGQVLSVRVF